MVIKYSFAHHDSHHPVLLLSSTSPPNPPTKSTINNRTIFPSNQPTYITPVTITPFIFRPFIRFFSIINSILITLTHHNDHVLLPWDHPSLNQPITYHPNQQRRTRGWPPSPRHLAMPSTAPWWRKAPDVVGWGFNPYGGFTSTSGSETAWLRCKRDDPWMFILDLACLRCLKEKVKPKNRTGPQMVVKNSWWWMNPMVSNKSKNITNKKTIPSPSNPRFDGCDLLSRVMRLGWNTSRRTKIQNPCLRMKTSKFLWTSFANLRWTMILYTWEGINRGLVVYKL